MDFEAIKKAAEGYRADMTRFLRDLVAIPSESCGEEGVIRRIAAEMEKLGFDKVQIDGEGNVLGWMGTGDRVIAMLGHGGLVGADVVLGEQHLGLVTGRPSRGRSQLGHGGVFRRLRRGRSGLGAQMAGA